MIFYVFKNRNSFFTWMMLLASVVVSQSLEDSDQEKNVEDLDDLIAQATFGDKIEDRVSHQVIIMGLAMMDTGYTTFWVRVQNLGYLVD